LWKKRKHDGIRNRINEHDPAPPGCAPGKVYRAFLNAEAMAKWLPPNGFTGKVHHGCEGAGAYKISFTNFTTGKNSLARKHQVKDD
jgi:D-arabinose 1-dehydrogenase-like Zn-dependent alcohol dehydrogenase